MSEEEPGKILIICVDRDNDVGAKAGISTPIIGKDSCLHAAATLALADPEEADANTIFAAVKQYDELLGSGRDCEVIVVAGVFERNVEGDRKIRREVAETLKGYPAKEAVIISDGIEGEEVAPIINPLVPVVSIRKIVIKHSKSVEESYAVLGRYFKMLLLDPRYAKYALGIPGVIFVGLVIVAYFDPPAVPLVLIGLIGAAFVIRGFDIDRKIESIKDLTASGYLRLFTTIASTLIVIAGIISGISPFFASSLTNPAARLAHNLLINPTSSAILEYIPPMIGYFIQYSQIDIWIGLGLYITGTMVFNLLRQRARSITRNIVALIVLGLLYLPMYYLATSLITPGTTVDQFVAIVMFLVAVNFGIAVYMYVRISRRRGQTQSIGAKEP